MRSTARAEFDRLFLEFLADRERRMGSEAGGLHAFYSRRLQLGRAFNDNELAAAALALNRLPRYQTYVEIGAGFGQLTAWLAVAGLRAIAIERDSSRFDGLDALRALVVSRWPDTAARLHGVLDAFPCALDDTDPAQTLIVTTNLVFGASFEVEQRIINGIGGFTAALIDTQRFCRDRSAPAEWAELDARFAAAGLSDRSMVWPTDLASGGERLIWYRRA